ncbi:CBS domain-containing protein [Pontibacillus sp. HMF3514]|uniref:CBS domain-containing protein n=1 Tax=Pontibacillus sp. HMF3514 TaxID=2692425 RepID=UPI00131F5714|nr:CBS domain-containing protein [Pontibacillus sp. HMF3514]QHE51694.1 CBS domain-containing protein [Pontibacillus sp. HMF3514]
MPTLREYMTTSFISVHLSDDLNTLANEMKEHDVGFLPVIENDKYAGVVTDRDIVVNGLTKGSPEDVTASQVMTDHVVTGNPDMNVEDAARLMQENQIKRLLVIENEHLKGVVSLGDFSAEGENSISGHVVSEVSKGFGNN